MKSKIILEFGCNHNGSEKLAAEMIDEAAKLGIWGIKFQKRDIESLEYGAKYIPRNLDNSFGKNYYEHRKALELDVNQIKRLKNYAEKNMLNTVVTVFDLISAKQMTDIGFEYIKLPSQFLSHYALNRYLLELRVQHEQLKLVCSTGMHTIDEIENWQYIKQFDIVMYCKSIYPAKLEDVNFMNFRILKSRLSNCIGYSSHDLKGFAIPYAVCLGAEYIERHYTLDKEMKGSDHSTVSSDFEEMKEIMENIKYVEELLGDADLTELSSNEEKRIRKIYRSF